MVGAALTAAALVDVVHAMHDRTEGGLASGLVELVTPFGLGLQVIREQIRVFPETEAICGALDLDPLKLIASGALLVAVAPAGAESVAKALQDDGVRVSIIGEVRPAIDGITIVGATPRTVGAPEREETFGDVAASRQAGTRRAAARGARVRSARRARSLVPPPARAGARRQGA